MKSASCEPHRNGQTYIFPSESNSLWASAVTFTPLDLISFHLSATFFLTLCCTFTRLMLGKTVGTAVMPFCWDCGATWRSETFWRLMMCTSPDSRAEDFALDWELALSSDKWIHVSRQTALQSPLTTHHTTPSKYVLDIQSCIYTCVQWRAHQEIEKRMRNLSLLLNSSMQRHTLECNFSA